MDQYDLIHGDRRPCSPILRARLSPAKLSIIKLNLKYNGEVGRQDNEKYRLNQPAKILRQL